ncbi:glycosyltransferase [Thermococcus camini]|uniref:Putative Phosphatidylinositol N-acetylglucosaminyltransferase n=1 Tax=Thermococcus camini TaxID=2016373 RepID=A0A7G2D8T0_9EURY|nr:glycosyltransferase [Thermococcus camini]CAD5243342.1 putative Phosphatidylinositol N-acetylglucosaminyltransferase [Thermococcus camini]
MHNNTLIIIPAYNEELTIGYVVTLSKKYGDVLVVDDGSKDETFHIAISSGAHVIKHPRNMGKAQALKTAFKYAAEKEYEIIVCIDADGQHNPEEIPKLVEPILKDEADLVIGSRFLDGTKKKIPLYRRFGLWVLNTTANVSLNGTLKITDSQSGFRAMNRKALKEIMKINSNGYNVESDMLVYLAERGVRIREVPITVRYDVPNKHKKNPISHGFELLGGVNRPDRVQETIVPVYNAGFGSFHNRRRAVGLGASPLFRGRKGLHDPGRRSWNIHDNRNSAVRRRADTERAGKDGEGVRKGGMKLVRILRVAPDIYPYVVGGYGLHIHSLSLEQGRKGHHVEVYVISKEPGNEDRTYYSLQKFREIIRIWGNPISILYAFKLTKEWDNFDVVHAHSHLFITTLLAAILKQVHKTPLVVTNHGLVSQTAPKSINTIYNRVFGKYIFSVADSVIVYTSEEKRELTEWGIPPDKIKVIFNGIDTKLFKNTGEFKRKNIMWVGRLVPGKRPELAIAIFNKLREKYTNLDLKLILVGDGPLNGTTLNLVEKSPFKEDIIYLSFIPNEELPKYYSSAFIFLLTSTTEGLPRTVLEAFSCETPSVISKIPHLEEVIKKAGLMVEKNSIDNFLQKIEYLLENPKVQRKMGLIGRRKIEKHYSWDIFVTKNIKLYEALRRELR